MRDNWLCALAAGAASVAMGWLGLSGFLWTDYETEAAPAFDALAHGHVLEFLRLAPAYGGSLVERSPFALVPGLWGGGQLAVYRLVAVPCLLAGTALGVWLCARMRAAGQRALWRALAVGVCVANPMTLQALEMGHPEELLGACLCVGAVLVALRGRAVWAGVLLGLAIANKEWALVAVGPVLLALNPRPLAGRFPGVRIVCLAAASATAAAVLGPLLLAGRAFTTAVGATAVVSTPTASQIFHPWQVWWFFGHHSGLVHREGAMLPGYRVGPTWISAISHPLIVAAGLSAALALWLPRRRSSSTAGGVSASDALLLLAFVLLARCLLDTWDVGYYVLPCSIAMVSWETIGRRRAPIVTLAAVIAPWLALARLSPALSPDGQAALFLAWTLPLAGALAVRLYAPGLGARALGERRSSKSGGPGLKPLVERPALPSVRVHRPGGAQAQEMTVSSVGSPVSTS